MVYAALDGGQTRLTDMLVKVGKLTPEQAQTVRDRSKVDTDKELGLLMIHNGLLNQTEIVQGVRSYLLDTVYRVFTWGAGQFRFEPNQMPPEERIAVPVSLDNVMIEGGRRMQEWQKLRADLPDLDMTLRFTQRPDTNLRNINLSVDEWKVISFINARNTVRQIAAFLRLDEFQIRQTINRLRAAGLVELVVPPGGLRPAPAAVPPARAPLPGVRLGRDTLLRIIDGIRNR